MSYRLNNTLSGRSPHLYHPRGKFTPSKPPHPCALSCSYEDMLPKKSVENTVDQSSIPRSSIYSALPNFQRLFRDGLDIAQTQAISNATCIVSRTIYHSTPLAQMPAVAMFPSSPTRVEDSQYLYVVPDFLPTDTPTAFLNPSGSGSKKRTITATRLGSNSTGHTARKRRKLAHPPSPKISLPEISPPRTRTNPAGTGFWGIANLQNQSQDTLMANSDLGQPKSTEAQNIAPKPTNFLDLPYCFREEIYRQVLTSETQIDLLSQGSLDLTVGLLRTSRQIYEEARPILYGENTFQFRRAHHCRDPSQGANRQEIGYNHVLLLLRTIGETNISYFRYLYIVCENAMTIHRPRTTLRTSLQFQRDSIFLECLRLIGRCNKLRMVKVSLTGVENYEKGEINYRAVKISYKDYHFLRAMAEIRADDVAIGPSAIMTARVEKLAKKLRRLMTAQLFQ